MSEAHPLYATCPDCGEDCIRRGLEWDDGMEPETPHPTVCYQCDKCAHYFSPPTDHR